MNRITACRWSAFAFLAGLVAMSCGTKEVKFQQYYAQGEQLYLKNCSNCHQKSGKGLGLLFPPVDQSDYIDQHFKEVVCLIKYGKQGELVVNGKSFNKVMPGNPTLTDLEVAEIATYIYNTWDRQHGIVDVSETAKMIKDCNQ